MKIRPESVSDFADIVRVTRAAFAGAEHTCGREYLLPDALRAAGALSLSLVAETTDGCIAGHVAFSPVTCGEGEAQGWFGVGPLSVAPDHQRRGVGSALMREGLARLRAQGARGCVLVGYPDYYGRFGFRADPRFVYPGVPPEYFLILAFDETGHAANAKGGTLAYHPAFMSVLES